MLRTLAPVVAVACLIASPALAVDRTAVERQFQTWVAGDLWPAAAAAGVSRATFDGAFAGVTLDWSLPELQLPGEPVKPPEIEWQAEFRSPAPYFDESALAILTRQGRIRLAKWRTTLDAIEARYGVPAEILVAIWGKESSFGEYRLPEQAIRALATQAFMSRRRALFREELLAALRILQNGDISPDAMRSSWAGGLGQPQFQPRLFLTYAIDFDGDGRRDIWNSVPDTLASIANFLAREGWRPGLGWAYEAEVPAEVSCALQGPDQARPASEWARLGVTRADGTSLPSTGDEPTFLLMPVGRYGPAFIATANFNVIKQYNRSDLYALYVGHLADRFDDDRRIRGAWTDVGHFNRGEVKTLQEKLNALGYEAGTADGIVGYRTRSAVGRAQEALGLPVTCLPDAALFARLG